MLELKNITKTYRAGNASVTALSGVSINFRDSEFVAVLGQSGSGKTTLLNIIGGLDRYERGDLSINGRSTMHYRDTDWDSYRNHSVGFIFQSYNLIGHQTVLGNVELALTLSGISSKERRKRADEILKRVGLEYQAHKFPNQLSGGQMQRVAIARALVNNPDILLADEPTGALDSETSVQIMELIKEIAADKLVIMVTHNSELADEYADRIISLKDGMIIDDTNPFDDEECRAAYTAPPFDHSKKTKKNGRKTSMNLATALLLSLTNMLTKMGRTFLTSFAGSIGIIGIALILALSNGMRAYIDSVEKDTLANYPLTIETESMDLEGLLSGSKNSSSSDDKSKNKKDEKRDESKIYRKDILGSEQGGLDLSTQKNDLKAFKNFLAGNEEIATLTTDIKYGYDIDLQIYKSDSFDGIFKVSPSDLDVGASESVWSELIGNGDNLSAQYDVLAGHWPENETELVLFVNEDNEISDYMLYALGLEDADGLEDLLKQRAEEKEAEKKKTGDKEKENEEIPQETYDFDEFLNLSFTLVPNTAIYGKNAEGYWEDRSNDDAFMKKVLSQGTKLKVVGIVRPAKDKAGTNPTTSGLGYMSTLTVLAASKINESEIVKEQQAHKDIDVFTGLPFKPVEEKEETPEESTTAVGTDVIEKPSVVFAAKSGETPEIRPVAETFTMPDGMETMTEDEIYAYIDENVAEDKKEDMKEMTRLLLKDFRGVSERKKLIAFFDSALEGTDSTVSGTDVYTLLTAMSKPQKLQYLTLMLKVASNPNDIELPDVAPGGESGNDNGGKAGAAQTETTAPEEPEIKYSLSTYEENIEILGVTDPETPDTISLYPVDFEAKERIKKIIDEYNEKMKLEDNESGVIAYNDYVSFIMEGTTQIINVITYILIAFVAISLIVSSIMISVITRISVLERTKEIGILRAIGASRSDISHVFNSETIIIGFFSGVMGVLLSLLMILPINAIIRHAANIDKLASLPVYGVIALIAISVLLNLIAGLSPSRKAAKQDPVIALRSE